ncbi:flagellar hook assembly protein FlgD [Caenispirillum bisanense]|uniref:flagellar hook assembly protein FlgD n=1 Tax=Caenispirillum bisanense TaxID=414052 RepID=UPI0031DA4296
MTTTNAAATAAGTNQAASVGSVDTKKARAKIGADLDAFLLMLTTQLQNQDPLSPMESNEFTQQLTSFAQVEQQIGINENLQSMMSLQKSSMNTMALGFLGKYAEIEDNVVHMKGDPVKFAYNVSAQSKNVTIELRNKNGQVVKTINGNLAPGAHVYTWNGLGDDNTKQPNGDYTVTIKAVDKDDKPVRTWTTVQAKITGVSTDGTEPYLTINGVAVPMREINAVTETPT